VLINNEKVMTIQHKHREKRVMLPRQLVLFTASGASAHVNPHQLVHVRVSLDAAVVSIVLCASSNRVIISVTSEVATPVY